MFVHMYFSRKFDHTAQEKTGKSWIQVSPRMEEHDWPTLTDTVPGNVSVVMMICEGPLYLCCFFSLLQELTQSVQMIGLHFVLLKYLCSINGKDNHDLHWIIILASSMSQLFSCRFLKVRSQPGLGLCPACCRSSWPRFCSGCASWASTVCLWGEGFRQGRVVPAESSETWAGSEILQGMLVVFF